MHHLDEPDDNQVAALIRLFASGCSRLRCFILANETAIEVGQGDSLAHFEALCNEVGDAWDLLRLDGLRVQNIAEQELAADEGGDLDLDWAGDFRRNVLRHYIGDQAFDLLSVLDGVKGEQVLDRLIQAICLHVLTPPR